jgi:hypothetical protein
MNDTLNENKEAIFSYRDSNGEKFWTPNPTLAQSRAESYGTDKVYVEYYDVEEKK